MEIETIVAVAAVLAEELDSALRVQDQDAKDLFFQLKDHKNLLQFKFEHHWNLNKKVLPKTSAFIETLIGPNGSREAVCSLLVSIIAKSRHQRANGLAYVVGIYLMSVGVPVEVFAVFNHLNISPCYTSVASWFKDQHLKRKAEIRIEVVFFFFLIMWLLFSHTQPQKLEQHDIALVIDNINRLFSRRHHSVDLQNQMFNGTMRAAFESSRVHSVSDLRILEARRADGMNKFSLLVSPQDSTDIKKAFNIQVKEILAYMRNASFSKRPGLKAKTTWWPMEVVQKDSKYTDQMVEILDDLHTEASVTKFVVYVHFFSPC